MMCDSDVAPLLMEEVAEFDCSTFLMEEIEIEMQQEQLTKFNTPSVQSPNNLNNNHKSNYNHQLVPTGLTSIATGNTESAVTATTATATNLLSNHNDSGHSYLSTSQASPVEASSPSEIFTTFLEDVEEVEVVECISSEEPIECEEEDVTSPLPVNSCSKINNKKYKSDQSSLKSQTINKQQLPPPPPSTSTSQVCKWTDCDWPGSYEDLVDHIRELHVELQPFDSTQLQLFLNSHKNNSNGSRITDSNSSSNMGSSSSRTTTSSSSTLDSTANSPSHLSSIDENPAFVQSSGLPTEASTKTTAATTTSTSTNSSTSKTSKSRSTLSSSASSKSESNSARVPEQEPEKSYVCLWEGCKVYGVRSQKRSWLDRHVLQHSGDKPFKCIVENCGSRFKSQSALEKHVNHHFTSSNSNGNNAKDSTSNCSNSNSDGSSEHGSDDSTRRTTMMRAKSNKGMNNCCKEPSAKVPNGTNGSVNSISGTPCKLNSNAKKRKVPRLRRVLVRGYSEDFFDSSVMDIIQFRLFKLNHLTGSESLDRILLQSKVSCLCLQ